MELRHIRYFLAVTEEGHMTRAAERLGIQQPPLSVQIRALESELGVPLFRRHPKGMELTEAGRTFECEARRILADLEHAQDRMANVARGEQGVLKVAFTSSSGAHTFTPNLLRTFRQAYPEVQLVLSEDTAAAVTEQLVSGGLHCALIRVPVDQPKGIIFETLLREPVLLALPSDCRLAPRLGKPRTTMSIDALRGESVILVRRPGAPGLYGNLLALCDQRGFQPRVVAEVERMMTNLNLVAAGVGVSVVPASMEGIHANDITYVPILESSLLDAPLTLAYRADEYVGVVVNFLTLARKLGARTMKKHA